MIHFASILATRGVSNETAALAISLFGGSSLLGRFATGYLLDRFSASCVAILMFIGVAMGILASAGAAPGTLSLIAACLIGFDLGAETDLIPYMVSRYFGLSSFGEIYGYMFTTFPLGGAVGPFLIGCGFDFTGSYSLTLASFLAAILLSIILISRLKISIPLPNQADETENLCRRMLLIRLIVSFTFSIKF